jgi:hypothetical protein
MHKSDFTLPLHFGAWLGDLAERVEAQAKEIKHLKERLESLEPVEAPLSPARLCARHGLKLGTVRAWLFHRTNNGLEASGAVVTRGRRIYLYETAFLGWLRGSRPAGRRLPRR